jgi:OFA family oxalate/formate antiporter-like MFS transporter
VFFAWGEIYSLFPSTCADTFGSKYATTNAGLLYTAKGTASFLVPIASLAQEMTGSWETTFYAAAAVNALAALTALLVLKPLRNRTMRKAVEQGAGETAAQPA